MPVKTIAMPVLVGGGDDLLVAHRAAGLDDGAMPVAAALSMPSRNGKKASEAITARAPRGLPAPP
jgi:hypothetical protein